MTFALTHLIDLERVLALYPETDLDRDTAIATLAEAARFAEMVIAPLDAVGDREGLQYRDGEVTTPTGYREAYSRFIEQGWHALPCDPHYGGQGFPRAIAAMAEELWRSSNMAFTGCMTLTHGAIAALEARASAGLKERFLPALVKGRWSGTMNLTEPQAGSDLSAIRTLAAPSADGTYRVKGQKIFISWGRHDLTDNIIHLVLARTPNAPAGVRGLSMFLVPQQLLDQDGNPGPGNDVRCASIEVKVGQHSAPTTTMLYGSEPTDSGEEGAIGYLVGDLHKGLEIMFIMMNEARFGVGTEGLAATEHALQTARSYARERIQGSEAGSASDVKVPIIRHPDVRRMLMRMKAAAEGMRALCVVIGAAIDQALRSSDAQQRNEAQHFVDFMTPIFKGGNTEAANELTSLGVQIHGGFGYMEDCPAARHWRDVRISAIYEGTTAIQANDLVGRKIARDGGAQARKLATQMRDVGEAACTHEDLVALGAALVTGADTIDTVTNILLDRYGHSQPDVLLVSVPILELFWIAAIGWQLGRGALAAQGALAAADSDQTFLRAKIVTANFFAQHWMPQMEALRREITASSDAIVALSDDQV
ncbi:acyl-CoA dehydrogenase [Acetobacter sacchari]|uniref:Acyl-CoA dehydrogenase n=1 Tax=Acetobacter sacchari TaxID=2661687 RepID=A0ABS3M0J4_9PROT|nr:acyl-CoA dehydrogenase [Acetobacter sacchari]MBO1361702.1 acyl-CoA dehydrogenase [Acetobacter sacchari]